MADDAKRDEHLRTWLQDHLAAAVGGIQVAERTRDENEREPLGTFLAERLPRLQHHRDVARQVLESVGGDPSSIKEAAAWLSEKVARLKLNNRLTEYSALSRVEEIEGLLMAFRGRSDLWHALAVAQPLDARLTGHDFAELRREALDDIARLEELHADAVKRAFVVA